MVAHRFARLLPLMIVLAATSCAEPDPTWTRSLAGTGWSTIVDDQHGAPTFTITGDDWTTWGTLGYGYAPEDTDYHYLSSTVGGSDRRGTATWTPDLPQDGTYRIEAWYRLTGNRTQDADHFVYDGYGYETHIVLDQYGDGPSGWVPLGDYWCVAGSGGCTVVLDGTDDDESDEANAMQFTLIDGEPPPPPEECEEYLGLGQHSMEFWAGTISSSGWSSDTLALGAEDGTEAHSENVDDGEHLTAGGWEVCDPIGEETIDAVEVEVKSRMQYDSGQYQLILALDGGGDAYTTWSHTGASWDTADITSDRGTWTWSDVDHVNASVTLHDHPGGARDSDAWVDSYRLRVTYTTTSGPDGDDDTVPPDDDTGDDDAGAADDDDDATIGPGPQVGDDDGWQSGCGCTAVATQPGLVGVLVVAAALVRARFRTAR